MRAANMLSHRSLYIPQAGADLPVAQGADVSGVERRPKKSAGFTRNRGSVYSGFGDSAEAEAPPDPVLETLYITVIVPRDAEGKLGLAFTGPDTHTTVS